MTRKILLILLGASAFVAVSGCSTMPPSTHSWTAPVTQARYNADNRACSPDNQPQRRFLVASDEFVAYRDCMQGLGYDWVALR